jgi:hypothetical protein
MSRRISFVLLAATAALIATQAAADPECFGDTCHLPAMAEPPAAPAAMPLTEDPAAPEASAAAPETTPADAKPVAAKALPQAVAAPQDEPQPLARRPLPRVVAPVQTVADVPSVPRATTTPHRLARIAPRPLKERPAPRLEISAPAPEIIAPPADYARTVRVSSPGPNYVVGYQTPVVGGIVMVTPQVVYGAGRAPVYMFAPGAKIISIDGDD